MTQPLFPPQGSALCAETDPEVFYPSKGGSTVQAKQLCFACPERLACLDYALTHGERFGIWGGMTSRERRRLVRGQAAEKSEAA
ncbi:WhiB family transcriptional regulator [Streptomyces sp. NPDC051994]|uniref:WhiB family transcriptional regulator n=1 Tax=unclassified Streptomyces TaxID=2593676 RepID=UPI00343671FC